MTKRPLIWVFLPLFLGVFWVALGSAPAGASVIYSQNFDTLNLGNLSGQNSWVKEVDPEWQVQNTYYHSSPNALRSQLGGGGYSHSVVWRNLPQPIVNGYVDVWLWAGGGTGASAYIFLLNEARNAAFGVNWNDNGAVSLVTADEHSLCQMELLTWTKVQMEFQLTPTKQFRGRCVGINEWSEWIAVTYPPNQVDTIEFLREYISENLAADDLIIASGSLAPIYSVAITQPINATTTADFASWQVDYQFFGGNASSTNTEDLRISVDAAATSSENAVGYYSDWYSLFNIPDNSTSVRTLIIPKANVLLANHQWWAWAKLYYWNDPEPLAESAEISFYVSTSTRAWPYPGTTTPITLGFQCDAYTFPVSQMCSAAEWLIMPQQSDLAVFNSIKDEFALKAPVGYFTAAKDIIATLKSGTPTIEIAVLGGIMEPLIVGLTMLLWLVFLFWLFKRISNLDI